MHKLGLPSSSTTRHSPHAALPPTHGGSSPTPTRLHAWYCPCPVCGCASALQDDAAGLREAAADDADEGDELFTAKGSKRPAGTQAKAKAAKKGKAAQQPVLEEPDEDGDGDADGDGKEGSAGEHVLGLSKKDPVLRRRELLGSGAKSLAYTVATLCAQRAGELVRSASGCDLVVEVARGGQDGERPRLDLHPCPPYRTCARAALGVRSSVPWPCSSNALTVQARWELFQPGGCAALHMYAQDSCKRWCQSSWWLCTTP